MSGLMTALTLLSLAVLAFLSIYNYVKAKNGRRLILQMLALVFIVVFLYKLFDFPFSSQTQTARGTPKNEVYLVIALYFFMVLGMLAHFFYTRFEQPKQLRKKFDLGRFVAPIFASPIIFIPLLGALQNAELQLSIVNWRLSIFDSSIIHFNTPPPDHPFEIPTRRSKLYFASQT